jgi:hypothetical protein
LLVGVMASSSFLVMDVKEGGPGGMHIIVPVPLFLAQIAMSFVPEEHPGFPVDESAEYILMAERLIAELENISDAELVRVEEKDELVVISKTGDVLEVEVFEGEREQVLVNLPISAVQEILGSFDGETFEAYQAVAALRGISRTVSSPSNCWRSEL